MLNVHLCGSRVCVGRRVQLYVEPRDLWVGVYIASDAVYVCPLPMLVIKFYRRQS